MQTAAMQYHTPTEYHFVDAPYSAVGPPDKGIATYYPNNPYYEWFVRKPEDKYSGLSESMDFLLQYIKEHGPFDGLLGFSQGASIVTRLARLQQLQGMEGLKLCKFVILIGGVTPGDLIPVSPHGNFLVNSVFLLHCSLLHAERRHFHSQPAYSWKYRPSARGRRAPAGLLRSSPAHGTAAR
jgi:hypothetical protein